MPERVPLHIDGQPLPRTWASVSLSTAGSIQVGRQRSPSRQNGDYPTKYLRAANITQSGLDLSDILEMDFRPDEREVFGLMAGDIVIAEASGSPSQVGRSAVWGEELPLCCFQNTVIRFRPFAAVTEYAQLVFRKYFLGGDFRKASRGVGIQHLSARRMSEMPFPLPSLQEQERIAAEVGPRLEELRNAEKALTSALEKIRTQKVGILAAAATGQLTRSTALRDPDGLPSHWGRRQVGEVGEVRLGKSLPGGDKGAPNARYLCVANVLEDEIDVTDVKEMFFTDTELERYELVSGDILLNEGQSIELVGRPAMVREEASGLRFQNSLIRFRAGAEVNPEFALLVFRHYLYAGEFSRVAKRSTNIAHLGQSRFSSMQFPVPPMSEQLAIVDEARARLSASNSEDVAVSDSRSRLPALELELLSLATTGGLSEPQDGDEPVDVLLRRLTIPPTRVAGRTRRPQARSGTVQERETDGNPDRIGSPNLDLATVLADSGEPLAVPDLFARAGYQRDSSEHVELFYLQVRDALGKTIRQVGEGEEALLEVIPDAP